MFQNPAGRLVGNLAEAENYLFDFIRENRQATDRRMIEKSHDFDLYLPWVMEILDNIHEQEGEKLSMHDLHRLYMDAAWDLVMQGCLRPGPRAVNGDMGANAYAHGYSLTTKGEARLSEGKPTLDPRD